MLGIHRTSIYKGDNVVDLKERKFYRMKEDEEILIEIKKVLNLRPTYGYRRINFMVNKERSLLGKPALNHKRIYRIMKINNLLVNKFAGKSITKRKTGKIMTLKSNSRWCSDGFEIKCFNGEKVYVVFSLDTCDREAISFLAKRTPILKEDVQWLMIRSVEKRFGALKAPNRIQWLTDRGAVYRALETQYIARNLNLEPCFTAAYSPQSNGMAEAFVKTIKRDYVYNFDCYSADVVLKNIRKWFQDYNQNAPHSALGMKSPAEFRKLNQV